MLLIPEGVKRFQAASVVSKHMVEQRGCDDVLLMEAKKMGDMCLREIVKKCITQEEGPKGIPSVILRFDVLVLSPSELEEIILNARTDGMLEARRFNAFS